MKKSIYSLLILSLCLTVWSHAPEAYAQDAKAEGKRLCLQGKYVEAKPYLEKAIRQNSRSGALWYLSIVRQHLYDFDGAIEAIENYRTVLSSDSWLSRADSLLAEYQIGQRAFNHCQDVVIIDSLLVDRDRFFEHYRLGAESGRILDDNGKPYYENLAADYQLFSTGHRLEERHQFQGQWEERRPVAGVGSDEFNVICPFLRSDGETLYFACDSTPGMGGFDIYRTTWDSESNAYYQPERLGMPFNSPYNDYMMAIDETHQVGWWATDRNAPAGRVLIYLFLLEEDPLYLDEPTVSRARIDCIAETWRDKEGYTALVEQLKQAPQQVQAVSLLHIVINDNKIYTSLDQFRNSDARKAYERSVALTERIADTESNLEAMRNEYHKNNATGRSALAKKITETEASLFKLYDEQRKAMLLYRRLEQ